MTNRLWKRFGVGAALAALGWTAAIRAQSAPADPWTRVPELPTGCYYDAGDVERLANADAALTADYARQKRLNDELALQFQQMDMRRSRTKPTTARSSSRCRSWIHPAEATARSIPSRPRTQVHRKGEVDHCRAA